MTGLNGQPVDISPLLDRIPDPLTILIHDVGLNRGVIEPERVDVHADSGELFQNPVQPARPSANRRLHMVVGDVLIHTCVELLATPRRNASLGPRHLVLSIEKQDALLTLGEYGQQLKIFYNLNYSSSINE